MNPRIALALCLIFIIVGLIIDHRRNKDLTSAYFIPLIWLMIIISRFVSQWLNVDYTAQIDEGSIYEGNAIDRVVFSCLIIIGLIVVIRRKIAWSQLVSEYRWLFGYFLYCGISILWSDFPFISFKRWIKEFGGLIMVLIIMTENNPFEALQSMIRRCAFVFVPLSIVFIKYYPELGRYYNPRTGQVYYHGASIGKNGLGVLCLICGFFVFVEILRWWRKEDPGVRNVEKLLTIAVFCMICWLMMLTNSITSAITLLVGILLMVGLGFPSIRGAVKNPLFLGIGGSIIGIAIFLAGGLELVLEAVGRDLTFTGRTEIWEKVLSMKVNPLIGVGYESFWLGDILSKWDDYFSAPNQSHNGYLEIYVNLGIVGLGFIAGIFVSFTRKALRNMGPSLYSGIVQLSFFLIFWMYNVTEYGFRPLNSMWLVFLMLGILFSKSMGIRKFSDRGRD